MREAAASPAAYAVRAPARSREELAVDEVGWVGGPTSSTTWGSLAADMDMAGGDGGGDGDISMMSCFQ